MTSDHLVGAQLGSKFKKEFVVCLAAFLLLLAVFGLSLSAT